MRLLPNASVLGLICPQVGMKAAYEVLVIQLTVRVVSYLKRKEEVDVYDYKDSCKWWRVFDF